MRRREVITLLGSAAVTWPLAARAQQPTGKVHRVGMILTLSPVSETFGPDPVQPNVRAFVRGLRALGYEEGRNLVIERRLGASPDHPVSIHFPEGEYLKGLQLRATG